LSTVLRHQQPDNPWKSSSKGDDRFHAIFDAVKDGIFITDPATGHFIDVNKCGCEMYGYDMSEIIGRDIGFLSSGIHPYTLEVAIENSKRATQGESQVFEWQAKAKNGSLFWIEISITHAEIDKVPAIIAILRDISERKLQDEELVHAAQTLSAASEAKSVFLANMSHELRTPLNAIIGFSDLMRLELFGPLGSSRYREYVEDIHKSGVHLLSLINDVLDLSRLDAGRTPLVEENISLYALVGETCRIVEVQAEQSGLKLIVDVPAGLARLRADERRIRQILLNLLSNAIKFTPAGGTVTVKAFETACGMVLQVCDNGIGIAKADMPRVFERFGQVDSKLSRKYEGTGLGLPLARQLIELHGGALTLESEENGGTVVTILFPPERIVRPADTKELAR
jgi:PAS domain S-box-containing protein